MSVVLCIVLLLVLHMLFIVTSSCQWMKNSVQADVVVSGDAIVFVRTIHHAKRSKKEIY